MHYVLGHTIEEQAQAELAEQGAWAAKMAAFSKLSDDLAVTAFDTDPAERFEYGLQLFLDGVRQQLAKPAS